MLGGAMCRAAAAYRPEWTLLAPSRAELDLTDRAAVQAYFDTNRIDFVVHCAAKVGGIKANMADPAGFYAQNILINTHVIEEARLHDVPRFAFMGSSCMYPRDLGRVLREEDLLTAPLEPTNEGYALAKIGGARHCQYISEQYGLAYKTFIPCNLYGRGDHYDPEKSHLMAAIILKLQQAIESGAQDVEIWGSGEVRREFVYVDDIAQFVIRSYERFDDLPPVLNIGAGQDFSVNELYQIAAKALGYQGGFSHDLSQPVGMSNKLMDISKAKSFGWAPTTKIIEGICLSYHAFIEK